MADETPTTDAPVEGAEPEPAASDAASDATSSDSTEPEAAPAKPKRGKKAATSDATSSDDPRVGQIVMFAGEPAFGAEQVSFEDGEYVVDPDTAVIVSKL